LPRSREQLRDRSRQQVQRRGQRPSATSRPTPTPITDADRIEQLAREQFAGVNDRGQPYLREVVAAPGLDRGYVVSVDFNADDSFTNGWIKRGIEMRMQDAYASLYQSDMEIETAIISAYFPLTDRYGNTSVELVYRTELLGEDGERINWDEPYAVDWENVWIVNWIHPDLAAAD
jgi:hypothetical protein